MALFLDLLKWQPAALTLILDAGIHNPESGWPSWLPDWRTTQHNAWLVDRCRLEKLTIAAPVSRTEPPTVSGVNLILKGHCVGIVRSSSSFSAITDKDNQDPLIGALSELTQWLWSVEARSPKSRSHEVIQSVFFAILEGLFPERRGTTYRRTILTLAGARSGRPIGERRREVWQAPYNSEPQLDDFRAFDTLYSIVARASDTSMEDLLARIQRHEMAFDYFARIVNKIAEEQRCLFVLSSHLAGSGPLESMAGDNIFLLPRVRAPVALRSQQN
ncbi:MAG: hypothetical protein Q9160_009077 [Pyrenula sp. 1 TL-2023]